MSGRVSFRVARCGLTLLCLALASAATAVDPADPRLNVLVVSIDTLRADHVGAYGYARETTPTLDRIASQGVLFEQALATSPWTLPSHASLVTGLYTNRHGLRDDHHQLSREVPVVTEFFGRAGYRVGATVNSGYLRPKTGLLRVCEYFAYFRMLDDQGARILSIDGQVEAAIEFLESEDPRPFFLFFHTYDVHSDYLPGAKYRDEFVRPYAGPANGTSRQLLEVRAGRQKLGRSDIDHLVDLYDGALRQTDDGLAKLFAHLDASGLDDSTLVVITSDHGEEFGDHGSVLHGRTVYEEMLRIPLLVRGPGVPKGVRIETPVSLVDVAPTLLASAGIAFDSPVDGRDLRALWSLPAGSDPASSRGPAFAQADRRKLAKDGESLTAVRSGAWKLIWDRRRRSARLFHLASDPREWRDVAADRPDVARELIAQAERHEASEGARGVEVDLSPDEIDMLRNLGYVE